MSFYQWKTDWDDYKEFCKRVRQPQNVKTIEEFWAYRGRQCARYGGSARNESERIWLAHGSPYYNVHPMLVDQLTKVNLEKVPTSLVEVPWPFDVVNIRLAKQQAALTLDATVTATQDVDWKVEDVPAGAFLRSMLMIRGHERILKPLGRPDVKNADRFVIFAFDFDVIEIENGVRSIGFAPLFWESEEDSLQDSIDVMIDEMKAKSESYKSLVENCVRMAITIGFLANSRDSMIEPDVLTKDKAKFRDADDERRKVLAHRAWRRGKKGFNVGNDLMFLASSPAAKGSKSSGDGSRELQYCHIRGGHCHAVRYGEGKKKVKIMWFRPNRVRDDLPFKPD